jgi:hypothetical protein
MPIFRDNDSEEGTFGPSMSAAMSLHRAKKDGKEKDGDKKDKVKHHLDKAKEHLNAAAEAHEGHEEDQEDMPLSGGGMSALMGGEEEE